MVVARFFKDGKFTGGWMAVNKETTGVINSWMSTPGCHIEFDKTEEIK